MKSLWSQLVHVLFVLILFTVPQLWLNNNNIFAGGEIYALIDPDISFTASLYTWLNTYGFGLPNINFTTIIYTAFVKLLNLFLTPTEIQKVIMGLCFAGSYVSFLRLLKLLFPNITTKSFGFALSSFFYALNPFSITMFPWFPTYGFLFFLTPLFIYSAIEFMRTGNFRTLLTFVLFSTLATNVALLLIAIFLFTFFSIAELNKDMLKVKRIMLIFIIFFLFNAYWILPMSQIYNSLFANAKVYQANFSNSSLIRDPFLNNFSLTSYYWLDKLNPYGELFYPYSTYYIKVSKLAMILIYIFIFYSLSKQLNIKKSILSLSLLLIGILFSLGPTPPFGFIYMYALKYIKYFGIFRASDIKFPFIIVIAVALLLAISFNDLLKITSKRVLLIFYIFFTLILFSISIPFFNGQIINHKNRILLPEYWQSISQHINSDISISRILLLPVNMSVFDKYSWGYEGGWLPVQLLNKSVIGFTEGYGPSLQEGRFKVISEVYKIIANRNYEKLRTEFAKYNISHVLVRNDFENSKYYSYDQNLFKIHLSENDNLNSNSSSLFTTKKTVGPLQLYTVNRGQTKLSTENQNIIYINPTKYSVLLNKAESLIFLESFDENWYLFNDSDSLTKNSFFSLISDIKFIFTKPLFKNEHRLHNNFANKWILNNNNLPLNSKYILFYRPQAYFYLGILITLTTVFLVLLHNPNRKLKLQND